jgi:heme/copper-type cytochrome/quinol oxidase subunit 2
LKYLSSQVNYSTIQISFYESKKYSIQFFSDFWDALKQGWQIFLHAITLLAYLWVIIFAFFIIRWGYKYYKRRKKAKGVDVK